MKQTLLECDLRQVFAYVGDLYRLHDSGRADPHIGQTLPRLVPAELALQRGEPGDRGRDRLDAAAEAFREMIGGVVMHFRELPLLTIYMRGKGGFDA